MANTPVAGEKEKVILGACDIYVGPYDGETALDLDTFTTNTANYFGNTQGGTTLEYTPETKTVEDDKGRVKKTFQTKAAATLKTGLLTYTLASLSRVLSVGTVTTPSTGKTRLALPGGKATLKRMAVVAVYTDDEDGSTIKVGIVATNTGALSMAFTKDNETVPEITFTAESNGLDDNLVIIEETDAGEVAGGLTVYSVPGSSTGKTRLAVSEQPAGTQSYKVKTAASVDLPAVGDALTTGWETWDGEADVTATTGNEIAVAIVTTSNSKCVRVGKTTVSAAS